MAKVQSIVGILRAEGFAARKMQRVTENGIRSTAILPGFAAFQCGTQVGVDCCHGYLGKMTAIESALARRGLAVKILDNGILVID